MKNAGNQLNSIIDQLMSTFILNACLVEQSIPDLTMDKIIVNIKGKKLKLILRFMGVVRF